MRQQRKYAVTALVLMLCCLLETGCKTTSHAPKSVNWVPRETKKYNGPEYTIGLTTFNNDIRAATPLGLGESCTIIMRRMFFRAGLATLVLSKDEEREIDHLVTMNRSPIRPAVNEQPENGLNVDFKFSGSITGYREQDNDDDDNSSSRRSRTSKIEITYSLVDVATGKPLLAQSATGKYTKRSGAIVNYSNSGHVTTLHQGALMDAMAKTFEEILEALEKRPFQGEIERIRERYILFQAGTRSRLAPGTSLGVFRRGVDVTHSETGKIIDKKEIRIGEVVVLKHKNRRTSEAFILSGENFQDGDLVRMEGDGRSADQTD